MSLFRLLQLDLIPATDFHAESRFLTPGDAILSLPSGAGLGVQPLPSRAALVAQSPPSRAALVVWNPPSFQLIFLSRWLTLPSDELNPLAGDAPDVQPLLSRDSPGTQLPPSGKLTPLSKAPALPSEDFPAGPAPPGGEDPVR